MRFPHMIRLSQINNEKFIVLFTPAKHIFIKGSLRWLFGVNQVCSMGYHHCNRAEMIRAGQPASMAACPPSMAHGGACRRCERKNRCAVINGMLC